MNGCYVFKTPTIYFSTIPAIHKCKAGMYVKIEGVLQLKCS